MSNFEDACLLSWEKWTDSFPDDIPMHNFSEKHTKKMNKLFETAEKCNRHGFSKKTIKMLIIAAVLLGIATTAFAIPTCKDTVIKKYANHSEYEVADVTKDKKVKSLTVEYIPSGYKKAEEEQSDYFYLVIYKNGDKHFCVEKEALSTSIGFDTEEYDSEKITINGMDAVYFRSDDVNNGLIFNNGEYIFVVNGNIDKDELINIAENVK